MNFKIETKRLSMMDHPLAPGSIAIAFTESETGEKFSDWVEKILTTSNISELQFRSDLFNLIYWINFEIFSEPTDEDLQDLRYGFAKLDEASIKFRVENATDDKLKIKESARRTPANLHIRGLFNVDKYMQEFDTCCLDISELSKEDIEKGLIFVASVAQRENPTVYILPTSIANSLKDLKDTSIGKTFSAKAKLKCVFAPKETNGEKLENISIREI